MWCMQLNPQNNDTRVNLTVYLDRKKLNSEMDLFSANVVTCFNDFICFNLEFITFLCTDSFRVASLFCD